MTTPFLSFSDVAFAENVRRWNQIAVASDHRWAAALTAAVPMSLLRDVVLPVTKLAACSTIRDAEYLAAAGFEKIILTGRAVHPESLRRLRSLAEQRRIVAVIDHFRHAELLSQCADQSDSEIQVLIEVDVGRQSSGVRPGADALLLATAASQWEGLNVIGVFVSAGYGCAEDGSVDADPTAIVTIAEHALRSLRDVAACGREIVVSVSSASPHALQETRINCLVVCPFADFPHSSGPDVRQPSVCLTATVISRPTLEWCVIDAGRMAFGGISGIRVHAPTGAVILHSSPETSTLQLSGEARDLRIGDSVQLVPRHPEQLLNYVSFAQAGFR